MTARGLVRDATHYVALAVVNLALLVMAAVLIASRTNADILLLGASVLALGFGLAVVFGVDVLRTDVGLSPLPFAAWVSTLRLVPLALLAGVLAGDALEIIPWLPAGLFAIAAGLDAVDGAVARWRETDGPHGETIDRHVDALTVLVGAVVAIALGVAPIVFIAVGIAQYAFLGGIGARRHLGLGVNDLPESRLRRLIGAVLFIAIWVALLPPIDASIGRVLTSAIGVVVLLNFARDFLAVSGRPIGYSDA